MCSRPETLKGKNCSLRERKIWDFSLDIIRETCSFMFTEFLEELPATQISSDGKIETVRSCSRLTSKTEQSPQDKGRIWDPEESPRQR